ncbi:MAG: GntR family transcriptional regulator [Lentisphaeria bacterium]|nr:GntR family transcriptional regulator [Lentisphaeria bacterium]
MPKIACNVIHADLFQQIEGGLFAPGAKLPSENELMKRYSVSRMTMRKVLRMLADEGYVASRAGIGWEVLRSTHPGDGTRRAWRIGIDRAPLNYARSHQDRILQGILRAAETANAQLIYNDYWNPELLEKDAPDALLLIRPRISDIGKHLGGWQKPACFINRFPENPAFSCLAVDYAAESKRAVEYLLRTGHRRIAFMAPNGYYAVRERLKGYRRAFSDNGFSLPPELVIRPDGSNEISGELAKLKPTAVFLPYAPSLPHFLLSAERAHLRVPDDLSVICFDDLSDMPSLEMPVSHIRMPLFTMGFLALEHLLRRLEDPAAPPLRRVFEADLAINSSCKALTPIQ